MISLEDYVVSQLFGNITMDSPELNCIDSWSLVKITVFGMLYGPCIILLRIYITNIHVIATERYIKNYHFEPECKLAANS